MTNTRSEKWQATRHARELALFSGQKFSIVREIQNQEFKTPLGYSAKSGYEVRNDRTGDTFKVGKTTLRKMALEYGAVTLPAPKKRGRPKKLAAGGPVSSDGHGDQVLFSSDHSCTVKQENGNDPGAHPVSEPDGDDRSGSLAGPTYANPNEDVHLEP